MTAQNDSADRASEPGGAQLSLDFGEWGIVADAIHRAMLRARQTVRARHRKLRYLAWDGAPAVVAGDAAVFRDLNGSWVVGASKPILETEWRDAPEMSRDELAARFPTADLDEAERLLSAMLRAA